MSFFKRSLCILSLFVLTGCSSYRCCHHMYLKENDKRDNHPLYTIIPSHRLQIHWYDFLHWTTWMLFGNDDDGIFGEGKSANFCPNQPPTVKKALAWYGRNPLHNFFFYTIGSANRSNSQFTLIQVTKEKNALFHYQSIASTPFPGKKYGLYLALHGGKPFISLRFPLPSSRRFDFYLGWRERGNFGIKAVVHRSLPKDLNLR